MTQINSNLSHWRALLDTAIAHNDGPHSHFAQLATVVGGTNGHETRPAVRTVTVRFFLDDGRLLLSTDMRNEKVQDIANYPACELCWYFTQSREQFRLSGRAQVVSAQEARKEAKLEQAMLRTWQDRSDASRASYTWPQPKRKLEDSTLFQNPAPSAPPDHFALLLIDVHVVDYLSLATMPHSRTVFSKLGGQWMERLVNP